MHFRHKGWCRLLWNFGMGKKDNKTHTQTHADRCTYTYLLTHSQTQVRMHTLTHRSMHTCSNLQMYAHTRSLTGLLTHRCMHTCTHLLTHSQMHAHMHKFTYRCMYTHTCTLTHSLKERKDEDTENEKMKKKMLQRHLLHDHSFGIGEAPNECDTPKAAHDISNLCFTVQRC